MHVDIIPNRNSRPAALLRETFRENGKVCHRTLLNISDLPADRILAIKRAFQGEFDALAGCDLGGLATEQGPQFGAIYVLARIAQEIGLTDALGKGRKGRLALLMVIAQIIAGMSKRAVVRWAGNQAVYEVLGVGDETRLTFDEHDLYEVLDDLAERRFHIESHLFKMRKKICGKLFLYDVTSSYLEGSCNELAAWGYNRDGKKGKKQIVIGLLTDEIGDPIAVDVFKGNTADPKTVTDQVKRLSERFGVSEVVFVGDRGMLKRIPLESINEADFSYITAITKPQVRKLIKDGVLQLDLFDLILGEIEHEGVRYIFRRNPHRAAELESSRLDRLATARALAETLSHGLAGSKRKRLDVALRKVRDKIESLKLDDFVVATADGRNIRVELDETALKGVSDLDGVYVLKTDTLKEDLDLDAVHTAYKSLYQVERDFRTMKTDLEVRPVFVRKENRTRGHVLVAMLALIVRKEFEKRLQKTEIEVVHAINALNGWTVLRESFKGLRFSRLPQPNALQQEILDAVGIKQPTRLSVYRKTNKRKRE
jgi:transposase